MTKTTKTVNIRNKIELIICWKTVNKEKVMSGEDAQEIADQKIVITTLQQN